MQPDLRSLLTPLLECQQLSAARDCHACCEARRPDILLEDGNPDKLEVGNTYVMRRLFTEADVHDFVHVSGDVNPIHMDPEAARAQGFEGVILPGLLCSSLFPAIIGTQFPGALYLSQELKFRRPALLGESLIARVIISKLSGSRVMFKTQCEPMHGRIGEGPVVDGTAVALIRDAQS
ncbi:hypothetical protein WJX72_010215 [[Myrmecia] bisecta]|uniref:MaoC-like domain-containing protein n=1 Tax=[Myrmecia] bisecta TaxID=41462 RepID=A0AAW1PI08_9CHLO